jgi:phospholipid/cholesterol/gamma-HCH transport system substrate-binding protein
MSLLSGHDQDVRALRRGTRLFIATGIVLVIALVMTILVRQGLFRPTAALGFVADSAQDISKGMPVRIAGFRVGSVANITLRADGQVDVAMEIETEQMRFVTRDAVAELRKDGFVGSATIEIVPGPDKTRLASSDARLAFNRSEGFTAMANQLRAEIVPILQDIKAITGTIADPKHGLPATLAHVRESTDALNTLLVTSNQQVGNIGGAATRVLGKAEEDLAHLGRTLETTNAQLPAILEKTQKAIDHVERIGATAEATVPNALRDGSAVATDVREIVDGAKQAWPIRNLITPPGPAQLKTDSDPQAEGGRAGKR